MKKLGRSELANVRGGCFIQRTIQYVQFDSEGKVLVESNSAEDFQAQLKKLSLDKPVS